MDSIKEHIKKQRPNLSTSSVNSYNSILKNLFIKLEGNKDFDNKIFKDKELITNHLKDVLPKQRKTILSALVVYLDDGEIKDHYREQMIKDIKLSKEEAINQKRDETKDFIEWNDVINIYNAIKKDVYYLMKAKPEEITPKEINLIQDYVLLSLYVLIPPRRSLDYIELKQRDFNKESDNYIDMTKNKLIFNQYKTSKFYKTQEVTLPQDLKRILKKWSEINKNEYVLIDTKNKKLNQVQLNQRLNKIFDSKISVNALRHSYLSHKYKDIPELKIMLETAKDMGHSLDQAFEYIQK